MLKHYHVYQAIIIGSLLLYCFWGPHIGRTAAVGAPIVRSMAIPASIINSGSTNTCPYTINVDVTGYVTYTTCDHVNYRKIPFSLAKELFTDLNAVDALENLPFIRCEKSGSFGSTTIITYGGHHTSDLSCPSLNVFVLHLDDDANTIQLALHLCLVRYAMCV